MSNLEKDIIGLLANLGINIPEVTDEAIRTLYDNGTFKEVLDAKGMAALEDILEDEEANLNEDLNILKSILVKFSINSKEEAPKKTDAAKAKIDSTNEEEKRDDSASKSKSKSSKKSVVTNLVQDCKLSDDVNLKLESAIKSLQENNNMHIVSVCVNTDNTKNPKQGIISESNLKKYLEELKDPEKLIADAIKTGDVEITGEGAKEIITKGEHIVKAIRETSKFIKEYKPGTPVEIKKPASDYSAVVGLVVKKGDNTTQYVNQNDFGRLALNNGGNLLGVGDTANSGIALKSIVSKSSKTAGVKDTVEITTNKKFTAFLDKGQVEVINKDVDKQEAKKRFDSELREKTFNSVKEYYALRERTAQDGTKFVALAKINIKVKAEIPYTERANKTIEEIFGTLRIPGQLQRFDANSETSKNVLAAILRNTEDTELPESLRKLKMDIAKEIAGGDGNSSAGSVDSEEIA